MVSLTNHIIGLQECPSINSASKLFLCRTTLPVLIGLARAMGRFSTSGPPLICRIFPKPEPPLSQAAASDQSSYKRSLSNFRNIIPRSLSGNLHATVDILAVTAVRLNSTNCVLWNWSISWTPFFIVKSWSIKVCCSFTILPWSFGFSSNKWLSQPFSSLKTNSFRLPPCQFTSSPFPIAVHSKVFSSLSHFFVKANKSWTEITPCQEIRTTQALPTAILFRLGFFGHSLVCTVLLSKSAAADCHQESGFKIIFDRTSFVA